MKNKLPSFTKAITLIVLGAALYYLVPVTLRMLRETPPPTALGPPLEEVTVEGATPDNAGDYLLTKCLIALERRNSVKAQIVQTGSVAGQTMESIGEYQHRGRGASRQFRLLLQGRIGSSAARYWQVSDGRFLWTDLSWDGPGQAASQSPARQNVSRIDLRRLRSEMSPRDTNLTGVQPGQAAAANIDLGLSAGLGGLPMLLESLQTTFHFGQPRQMSLRGQPVHAMIGRLKTELRDELVPKPAADGPRSPLPDRVPRHVLLAVGAKDLFPYLIEYRSGSDPLTARGLTDDVRLRESRQPLMRIEYRDLRFEVELADADFQYPDRDADGWHDATAERLAMLRRRREVKMAAAQATAPVAR